MRYKFATKKLSVILNLKVSLEIARLGRIFHVPQVSYLSTAVVLSNKELYPYFFRTVPSDTFQAKVSLLSFISPPKRCNNFSQAMIEVLVEFGWNYVSVVHTEGDYG